MQVQISSYGKGAPLVFFHGWGFSSQIWHPLIPDLENKYQIILVDLPGFGSTPIMNWEDFKEQLLSKLPSAFALMGWSLGGLYASRLAIEVPHRITYLINLSSSPRFIADDLWPGVSKDLFLEFHQKLLHSPRQTLQDFISLQIGKSQSHSLPETLPSKPGLTYGLECLMDWDLREHIKDITMPACFMFGRLDPITPINLYNHMQLMYPKFKYLIFKKAAHMAFISHSQLFIEELEAFLV